MKTRLLLMLLFVGSFSFAQTWNQVGATQFSTNFSQNGEITIDNSGTPYVLYENSTNNGVFVMKFNGTSWMDVGSGAISTENYNNLTIKINPVTNQPWVALKAQASGAASNIDVFSFDGNSWVSEGANIGGSFYSFGIQLQFSTAGVPRIVGMIISSTPYYKPSFYTKNGANWSVTTYPVFTGAPRGINARIDFYDFDNYTMAQQSSVKNYNVSDNNQTAHETLLYTGGVNYRQVSANGGDKYFAVIDAGSNKIRVGKSGGGISQPSGVTGVTKGIVTFRESITDNQQYLMYSSSSNNLMFQKYKLDDTWSVLPSIGIATNITDFFAKMVMNPSDGNMYVLYKDGSKMSVQKFSIETPLAKYYVNANVSGGNGSGDSWTNALPNLSNALFIAGAITTEVWVAAGTYKPGTSRNDSFTIGVDNIEIIGGFDGTETSVSQRDIMANPTILSGDLNDNDTGVGFSGNGRGENSYHVVKINSSGVLLDGFKIEDGHANGSSSNAYGSGLLIADAVSSFTLKNSELNNNMGLTGGALRVNFNINAALKIENSIFNNNLSRYGSGMYVLANTNRTVTLDITNTLFTNNSSMNNGGSLSYTGSAAWIRASSANSTVTTTITNCTFAKNTDIGTQSGSQRGALALGKRTDGNSTHNATINNSIFYENDGAASATTVAVNRGHTAMPNLVLVNNSIDEDNFSNLTNLTNTSNANPQFSDAANDDFTLQTGSPAIDSGDNSKIPSDVTTDLLGNARIHNTTVDMGAYEFGSMVLGVDNFVKENMSLKVYPNPTSSFLNVRLESGDFEKAEIYNLQGQKVLESTSKNINVSSLSSGMYLVKVENKTGNVSTQRFIKK